MRDMYIKYDVVVGFKLTGIRMGKGVISALNYVSTSDKSVKMTMTVSEFEEYQERMTIENDPNEESEFEKYDAMFGYKLVSIIKGKGKISGLKFVAEDDKTNRMIVTGDDLVAFEHYLNDLVRA